jgi:hypothetical protein
MLVQKIIIKRWRNKVTAPMAACKTGALTDRDRMINKQDTPGVCARVVWRDE